MAEQDVGDKQFDATPHKLKEAHKKGQVFKSKDMTQLFTFIVGFDKYINDHLLQLGLNIFLITAG
ncbi:MAG: EscU/YscU/HrcU family type III secretion system export apparatus switch protein [Candidatus Melainabacteria bacterium]|nr:EscU/YscU/HrcU family type III secretion system export apparatus switch protein [Candidatus Melainabacteria bacterium]